MKTTANILDISALPPAARREMRDFYQFLLSRSKKTLKTPIDTVHEHDQWVRDQVEAAVKEADDPATKFISHENVQTRWTEKKKALQARTATEK